MPIVIRTLFVFLFLFSGIAELNSTGSKNYYLSDHLGSTSVLVNSSGKLIEKTRYDPFGSELAGGNKSKYGYNGKEEDVTTGLLYYGARYYNPRLKRWTQADWIIQNLFDPQNLNRYSYVKNNPLKYIDPTGNENDIYDIFKPIGEKVLNDFIIEPTESIGIFLTRPIWSASHYLDCKIYDMPSKKGISDNEKSDYCSKYAAQKAVETENYVKSDPGSQKTLHAGIFFLLTYSAGGVKTGLTTTEPPANWYGETLIWDKQTDSSGGSSNPNTCLSGIQHSNVQGESSTTNNKQTNDYSSNAFIDKEKIANAFGELGIIIRNNLHVYLPENTDKSPSGDIG